MPVVNRVAGADVRIATADGVTSTDGITGADVRIATADSIASTDSCHAVADAYRSGRDGHPAWLRPLNPPALYLDPELDPFLARRNRIFQFPVICNIDVCIVLVLQPVTVP